MSVVPFDWQTAWSKYFHYATAERRPIYALSRLALWGLTFAVNQTGSLLDDMFWSSWRHHENPDPIFILGHQRSGTTLLHRSLASDAGLVASRLWQMIFPPLSVGILAGKVAAIDQHLGGFGGKLLAAWEERRFGEIDRLHQIRLNAVEED
ncbi:MAG: sulfotransferase, partial [Gammaproteobacteria bacterium]